MRSRPIWAAGLSAALAYLVTHYPGRCRYETLIARYPLLARWHAADITSFVGLGLIGVSLVLFKQDMVFPGWRALLPVLGATLLLASRPAWFNRAILSSRPMVWVGLISYPLYLWHWPIISFLHVTKLPTDGWVMGGALALSVLLAWLTYYYIEKRIRAQRTDYYIRPLCLIAVGVLAIGLVTAKGWIKPYLNIAELNQMMEALQDWDYPPPGGVKEKLEKQSVHRYASGNTDEVVYVGDSNMEHFAPRVTHLIEQAPQQTFTAVFITAGGCRPIPNVTKGGDVRCYALLPHVMSYIDAHPVKRLVLSGRWHDFLSFSTLSYRYPDGSTASISDPKAQEALMKDMKEFIRSVQKKGVEVILIQNVPSNIPDMDGPAINRFDLIHLKWTKGAYEARRDFPLSEGIDEKGRAALQTWVRQTHATLIDPASTLCKDALCPLFYDGNNGIYKDRAHLTYSYARDHATFMDQTILIGE